MTLTVKNHPFAVVFLQPKNSKYQKNVQIIVEDEVMICYNTL